MKTLALWPQDKAVVRGTGAPVIIVAWSLQYEVLFYFAFAAVILNRRFGLTLVAAFLIVAVVTRESGNSDVFPGFLNWSYFVLFGLGIGVSLIVSRPISLKLARLGWRLSLLLFALAGFAQIAFALETDHAAQLFAATPGQLFLGLLVVLLIASRAAIDLQVSTRLHAATNHLADPPWHIDAVGGRSHHQNRSDRRNIGSQIHGHILHSFFTPYLSVLITHRRTTILCYHGRHHCEVYPACEIGNEKDEKY